jgi:hypothetical protein
MRSTTSFVAPMHLIAGVSFVLAACATLPPPEYPSNHPASPEAPTAVAAPSLTTLRTYKSFSSAGTRDNDAAPHAGPGATPQAEESSGEAAHEHQH